MKNHKHNQPNPGSPKAVKKGCTCPVLDNGHGKGSGYGPGRFWISVLCPLHGSPLFQLTEKK